MLEVNDRIRIPDHEFHWTFVRSSGPGGQNVNKVASKAVLRWNLAGSLSLPPPVKDRLRAQQRHRITTEGELLVSSQRYRDQGRNVEDCLQKIRAMIVQALAVPKPRKPTRPTRSSREARLQEKRRRALTKKTRKGPREE